MKGVPGKKEDFSKRLIISLIILFFVLIVDQITKYAARLFNPDFELGFLSLVFVQNTGSAFGMFAGQNSILALIAIIFVCVFLFFYKTIIAEREYFAYFLIVAGAISNLIDRVFLGYVTDMISVGSFPVFNIADSSITIGAALLVYLLVKDEIKKD